MITCVTDLAWGDTGKGKIVDSIAGDYDAIVRFNGGPNAGHTVYANGKKMTFHHLPSGMFVDNPPEYIILSGGMVVNPVDLANEIKKYINTSDNDNNDLANIKNLILSDRIHCIMPWHIEEDCLSSKGSIGTTGKGIGPCYAHKMIRTGAIRLGDLLTSMKDDDFEGKDKYIEAALFLSSFITDERPILRQLIQEHKNILFESANGIHLDIDHGSYPFVTSSGCGPAYIPQSCGLPNLHIDRIIGITKAYTTRVGNGDLPTEIKEEYVKDAIRVLGKEYGTTTGRPRRIGWLDLDVVKEGIGHTGATEIAITHTDTISKACDMVDIDYFMCKMNNSLVKIPVWNSSENYTNSQKFNDFIRIVEDFTGLPVVFVGTGKDRKDVLQLKDYKYIENNQLYDNNEYDNTYDIFYSGLKMLIQSCKNHMSNYSNHLKGTPILRYTGLRGMGHTRSILNLLKDGVFKNICVFCNNKSTTQYTKKLLKSNWHSEIDVFCIDNKYSFYGRDFKKYDAIIFDNSFDIYDIEIFEAYLIDYCRKEKPLILFLN